VVFSKHQNRGDDGVKAGAQKHARMTSSAAKGSKPIDWERLATVLGGIETIEYAMVFGSARDGIVRAGSDLDVAIALPETEARNIDRLVEIVGKVEDAFGVTCDLTVLNAAGPVLRHEALKGRILFVRPDCENDFSDFYVRTCAEYEDLMAWRARQLAYRGYICPSMGS
jgi:predicted nucleotidyltransferase